MSTQVWWYVARATGMVAWALLAATVVWGLVLTTRLAGRKPAPAWLLDLHRFLGGLAVAFTALHLAGLLADGYVSFDLVDILVPGAAPWKPGAVALGVVSLYLLAAVEATSLAMRHIPRRRWHAVHLSSYVLFWSATFHFLLAGTDAGHPLARVAIDVVAALVVFLTLVRILSPRARPRPRPRPRPDPPVGLPPHTVPAVSSGRER
jgi:DMSO/TMAO reductase YedYZ heme-binding membrane subunit